MLAATKILTLPYRKTVILVEAIIIVAPKINSKSAVLCGIRTCMHAM